MKRAILCCILTGAFATAANSAEKVIIYGDDDYAPYSFVENGQLKGIYVDILKKAIEKMPSTYQIELQPVPWKRGLAELESGTGFGLFPPYMKKKERPYINPYSVPMLKEEVVLFCRDDVMASPRKKIPDDFTGLTIGVNAGFNISEGLSAGAKSGKLNLAESKGNDSNLKKLAGKRIDCYANDRGSILYTAKKLRSDPQFGNFKMSEAAVISGEDGYIGYSANTKVPYKADFIEKMNAALETVKKEGVVAKAVDAYLK
ncbi:MAG TPA: transporter substrate-binding domain-containing protein [Noviherbaspirillum sp.]|nr:transporter substrate-binding domain-containing protein [Noviherbaspirillum sp.]